MKYSRYQEAVFAAVKDTDASIFVSALAGSGKTTTIVQAATLLNPTLRVTFVAFNKSIAGELQGRLPSNVRASTLHSMGFANIRYRYPTIQLDENKMYKIVQSLDLPRTVSAASVMRLASLGKTLADLPDQVDYDYLIDRFELPLEYDEITDAKVYARLALERSLSDKGTIDYDDMIWLPALGEVSMYQSDVLFADESQDFNVAQIAMLRRASKMTGRVIAVGDAHQSIYGFRGADLHAVDNLVSEFCMETLPLSICYRCGKSIVRFAQTIVPEIESAENAVEGIVEDQPHARMLADIRSEDLVLCRTNAPLVQTALMLISMGKKAQIRGRDIGKGLQNLVMKIRRRAVINTIQSFLGHLKAFVDVEVSKLIAADRVSQAATLMDQGETLVALSEGLSSVSELEDRIATIFADNVQGITLSSVHRAKGTEAGTVWLLRSDLLPHPMAKLQWQIEQEHNLKYVAITRAKNRLVIVK